MGRPWLSLLCYRGVGSFAQGGVTVFGDKYTKDMKMLAVGVEMQLLIQVTKVI